MILHALKEYYDRKAADLESGIAPLGWERKELPYLFVITKEGAFVNIEDTRELQGKKKIAKAFLVPQGVKRSSGVAANLLWDNLEYVFGMPFKDPKKHERALQAHADFMSRLEPFKDCPAIASVIVFLNSAEAVEQVKAHPLWNEVFEGGLFVSFRLVGEMDPVFRNVAFVEKYQESLSTGGSGSNGRCLVTGGYDEIPVLHPNIKGINGANTTGASIVSFNFPAACSFGKKQGANSPVGARTVFAYTTALNTLLARGSRQKMTVGDSTVVFWSQRESSLENEMAALFDDYEDKDNPDAHTENVSALLKSVSNGAYLEDREPNRFYVLGLSPNSARIAVRFWHAGTVAEMSERIASWFDDLMIVHGPIKKDHLSMYRLLCSIAAQGKSENVPPNLSGEVMRSIFEGLPLPTSLLQSALRRIKVESSKQDKDGGGVSYERAKIIKACLNRKIRFNQIKEKELAVMLDKENSNVGYCLGRLFAVLERIQEEANPGINATIRGKYYASASVTPASVFGTLMRLKNHHLAKMENVGRKVNFERLLGEIADNLSRFPAHLKMDDQGQFAIGYYHQRQDFFTKKSEDNN